MRVLILGGSGMLGHQLFNRLSMTHDVRVTLHRPLSEYSRLGLFDASNAYANIELDSMEALTGAVKDFSPQVIVNAVAFIKQKDDAENILAMMAINSLLPRRLAQLSRSIGSRLIHMSTDGVFSGNKGHYRETDLADAQTMYGITKFLGEVYEPHCFTLRTSIIGREPMHKSSLLEWLLSQRGTVRGFSRAIYSGFTTLELARIIDGIVTDYPGASGLYHIASDPISKYDLLMLLKSKLNLPVEIVPDAEFESDLSLDSQKFRSETTYNPPSWDTMIDELAQNYRGQST
jgi:dTDP-4-dehydrorhamnose reductase